ncbi:MAG: ice-binding family protein [Candidatus Nitrotoga sp.]
MNKLNRMNDGATRHFAWHAAWLPQVCNPAHLQQLTALSHKSLMWLVMLLAAFVAGCGGGGGSTPDTTAPTVISTSPANLAIGVALNANIVVGFSEAMDAATITTTTFTLKQGTTVVAGAVSYTGKTATYNPTANLTAGLVYTATVTTGAKDLAGNALAAIKTWTFTTTSDITPPTVSSTIPADAATGVALNANITATFSEAMDPLTITTTTYTLKQGTTAITGVVTSPSTTTATFNPNANLTAGLVYTATVTTGVKDLAGNALAATKTWSFTTGTGTVAGVAPVDLGTAGNYAILAKAGVSTVPTSVVTGNVGVSPVARGSLTGWSLITEPTDTAFTSAQVSPPFKLYAADNVGGTTSADLGTAILDMGTAYTDAAGRTATSAATTNVGAGTLTSLTLVPAVYEWGSNVTIPTDLTFNGTATDVWILNINGTLDMAAAKNVILSGGALPQNIFWRVAGGVTIGANTHFEGIILGKTSITFNNLSSIKGRLLAQTAVTLDATTVTQP